MHRFWLLGLILPWQLACNSAPHDSPVGNPPRLHSGPNHPYHDLTELNYVTLWASGFTPARAEERICILNGRAQPCASFLRGDVTTWPHQPGAPTEFYLPALPFGENHFEIRRADGYALAATEFIVCRRVMEVDFAVGADGKVETGDDQTERVRTLAWKDGLAHWESVSVWADPTSNETRRHSYAYRVTDTVSVYDSQQQLRMREVRRYSLQGPPITSDTYAPTGERMAYEIPCLNTPSEFAAPMFYHDDSCLTFAPVIAVSFSHPGSDATWHTRDDHVLRMTEYFYLRGEHWHRGAPPDGQWLRTRFTVPPTQSTLGDIVGWRRKSRITDELHEVDPARPGLWARTLRGVKPEDSEQTRLVGHRKYEYQCAP